MEPLSILCILVGLLIIVVRAPMIFAPEATLRFFDRLISTDSRLRGVGLVIAPLGWALIHFTGSEQGGAAGALSALGWLLAVAAISLLAGPNCTTAVAVMAVAPLERAFGIGSIISSSYQSTSGGGRDGIAEFLDLSRKAVDQPEALRGHQPLDLPAPQQFPQIPAFNVFPQCEAFREGSDISTEEEKMEAEMRKMLHAPALLVHATAVRVPVLVGHSVSLALSLRRAATPAEAREVLAAAAGVRVLDEPWAGEYPTPLRAAGIDDVLVGRVLPLRVLENGLSLFASGDNLRKGNALNAVQVAECVLGLGRSALASGA